MTLSEVSVTVAQSVRSDGQYVNELGFDMQPLFN